MARVAAGILNPRLDACPAAAMVRSSSVAVGEWPQIFTNSSVRVATAA